MCPSVEGRGPGGGEEGAGNGATGRAAGAVCGGCCAASRARTISGEIRASVRSSHYETNYPLRNIHYIGANYGGSTTGLLIEMANYLRGKTLDGYSVWLLFTDEEAIKSWTDADSVYAASISRKNGRRTAR